MPDPSEIEATSSRPAYKELASKLREAVLDGKFPSGSRLPTEAELVDEYGVSRQTVRQAFAELVTEGLVYRVRGRGTFARPARRRGAFLRSVGSIHDLLALSVDTELELIQGPERRADVQAASRLRLDSDEVYVALLRRLHDGAPFQVSHIYVPVEVAKQSGLTSLSRSASTKRLTVIGLIDASGAGPIAGAYQSATAGPMPEDFAPLIDCEPGQPVLRIDRLYYNREGEPVELAINYFNPDRYSYRVDLRR